MFTTILCRYHICCALMVSLGFWPSSLIAEEISASIVAKADQNAHNAFPSIVKYGSDLLISYRNGDTHTDAGTVKLLRSVDDGNSWIDESSLLDQCLSNFDKKYLDSNGTGIKDYRDPNFTYIPEHNLLLLSIEAQRKDFVTIDTQREKKLVIRYRRTAFCAYSSQDGWFYVDTDISVSYWPWKFVWSNPSVYSLAYRAGNFDGASGAQGVRFIKGELIFNSGGRLVLIQFDISNETYLSAISRHEATETAFAFLPGNQLVFLSRTREPEGLDYSLALIGKAIPMGMSLDNVRFESVRKRVHGPEMIVTYDNNILVGYRTRNGDTHSSRLAWLNPSTNNLHEFAELACKYCTWDQGYPSFFSGDDSLYISYYDAQDHTKAKPKSNLYFTKVDWRRIDQYIAKDKLNRLLPILLENPNERNEQ